MKISGIAVTGAILAAVQAAPSDAKTVVQFSATVDVEQIVNYQGGTPDFQDPVTGAFPFLSRYMRALEAAEPWNPANIPAVTEDTAQDTFYDIRSEGVLSGNWTFDAEVLARSLQGIDGRESGPIGSFDYAAAFAATVGGIPVEQDTGNLIEVTAIDNFAAFPDIDASDIIVITATQFESSQADSNSISSGANLLLAGDSAWFEDADGAIPDFSRIVAAAFESEYLKFDGSISEDDLLVRETIFGTFGPDDLLMGSFGAADGSSEDEPLLPIAATIDVDGVPTYVFDVSTAVSDLIFVDPEIAEGYSYILEGAGGITAFQAPSFDAVPDGDGYTVVLPDGATYDIMPGELLTFDSVITSLIVEGIDPDLGIDVLDNATFVAGFILDGVDETSSLSQTALIGGGMSAIPVPAALPLLLVGLGGLGLVARRRG